MKTKYLLEKQFKQSFFIIIISCFSLPNFAQSWRWGGSGGTSDDFNSLHERARSVCTDIYGNVYVTSEVGSNNLQVSGQPLQGYNDSFGLRDAVISSFSCDGNYRWTKVIGGGLSDSVTKLGADAQGNIYAVGQIGPTTSSSEMPVHFDTDFSLNYASINQNIYKQSLYIIKYDSNGTIQWLRMPQAADITNNDSYIDNRAVDLQVDPDGTAYWFCQLAPGSYADGAFVVATTGFFVLKYNADGSFSSGTALDIHVTGGYDFSMTRNPNTGALYVGAEVGQGVLTAGDVIVNGQVVTKARFIAAFSPTGAFLWKAESASPYVQHVVDDSHAVTVDADNNVYFASSTSEYLDANNNVLTDTFGGVPFVGAVITASPCPFIAKLDANGNVLWLSSGTRSSPTAVVVNGNEVAISAGISNTQWQNLSYGFQGAPAKPYLARFDKATGAIIALNVLESNGGSDFGSALTVDSKGNYYMGGKFSGALTAGSDVLGSSGGSDFFVAKFGSDDCDFLATNQAAKKILKVYPNPVKDFLHVDHGAGNGYVLYDLVGKAVQSGTLLENGVIDLQTLAKGMYLLQISGDGGVDVVKVLRE